MNQNIKDQYWDLFKKIIKKIPKRKEIIILGEINARVGNEKIPKVMSVFGEDEKNENRKAN